MPEKTRAFMVGGFEGVIFILSDFEITVEKLVYGGDGLGRLDGRAVLAPFVLPGERVRLEPFPKSPGCCGPRCWRCWPPRRSGSRRRAPISRAAAAATISMRHTSLQLATQARHPGRPVAPHRQDRASGGNRRRVGRTLGLPQSRAIAYRRRRAGIPRRRNPTSFAPSSSARSPRRPSTRPSPFCARCCAIRAGRGSCARSSCSPTKRKCSSMFWRRSVPVARRFFDWCAERDSRPGLGRRSITPPRATPGASATARSFR